MRISVQQIAPDGHIYSQICKNKNELCHIFMGVMPQNKTIETDDLELDIGIIIQDDQVHFQFKSGFEYFMTKEKKKIYTLPLDNANSTIGTVDLVVENEMAKHDPPAGDLENFPVVRPEPKILATLKIEVSEIKN